MAPSLAAAQQKDVGLGERHLLDKIDKLRELGVPAAVPLPQIVVAGEQSAGKSSVLESLTRISFPRSVSLCTRFATEIICRRENEASVVITIQPGHGCSQEHAETVRAFRQTVTSFTGDAFASVFREAAVAMGIKTDPNDTKAPTFTRDVLRIEKSGPDEEHLTLIDVPGIFENETPGETTKSDIGLVKEMVMSYIKDPRTIILAVVPCNADIATQTIIRLASEVDPEGKRTLGVLTKPDLAIEKVKKESVANLVRGYRRDLQLGYCLVRNRGADDQSATLDAEGRDAQERCFFSREPWSKLDPTRVGIPALRSRLQALLVSRTRVEFPNVKRDLAANLKSTEEQLARLGVARGQEHEQRAYLLHAAQRFNQLVTYGTNAYYTGDPVFIDRADLRLITCIRELNDAFTNVFFEKGHAMEFERDGPEADGATVAPAADKSDASSDSMTSSASLSSEPEDLGTIYSVSFSIPTDGDDELDGILAEPYTCTTPSCASLMKKIEHMYIAYRGYELGTFGTAMIPSMFRLQAESWEATTLAHVSNAILVVHRFISALVTEACPDPQVRAQLWSFLLEKLMPRYEAAMAHARFLLGVELNGPAVTCNPEFDVLLRTAQKKRIARGLEGAVVEIPAGVRGARRGVYVHMEDLEGRAKEQKDDTCARIHDVVKSYYQVVRSRFVDNICVQAVDHCLLSGEGSPLRVFTSGLIGDMTAEQLEAIAGEDAASRNERVMLKERVVLLSKAMQVLRG